MSKDNKSLIKPFIADKNRESVLSGDTVYLDVINNGDIASDDSSALVNRRNTLYHDSNDQ